MRTITLWMAAAAALAATPANAAVRITEFMYQGAGGGAREFFELTNLDTAAVDVSGWTYNDDNPNLPVAFGAAFGSLAANESIILTELSAEAFRTYWNLAATVRVFTIDQSNLGSADTINIYNSAVQDATTLVDSVSYSGTTRGISRNRPDAAGAVANADFVNSASGDAYGSAFAGGDPAADFANPGRYPFLASAVPEPGSWALLIAGFGIAGGALRRRAVRTFRHA